MVPPLPDGMVQPGFDPPNGSGLVWAAGIGEQPITNRMIPAPLASGQAGKSAATSRRRTAGVSALRGV